MGKLYLAGEVKASEWEGYVKAGVKRRLLSFHYHNSYDLSVQMSHEAGLDLFLDSGAFSAFTQGVVIDPHEYAQFLKDWGHIWTVKSSIDHIGETEEGAKKSYENVKLLESLGAPVQPVFHVRERDYWLERYVDEGYPYILIGGMVPESTPWLSERLDGLWGNILCREDGTAKVKVHGFGLTDQKLMFRYPWESVDSSSWLQTGIYGSCMLPTPSGVKKIVFSDESPETRKINGWHFKTLAAPLQEQIREWLLPYGVTAEQCCENYRNRNIVNAASFQQMEEKMVDTFTTMQGTFF